MWIVSPSDHNRLCPVGCVGELVIEGPILARDYLGDVEKTALAFIENPTWTQSESFPRKRRFYKTGDIARYSEEGHIILLGRKDRQIKLRGQRIELTEIEHHLRKLLPEGMNFAVDVVNIEGSREMSLCLFLTVGRGVDLSLQASFAQQISKVPDEVKREVSTLTQTLIPQLSTLVPHYMVPSLVFPIKSLPLSINGKLDRKRLIQSTSSLTRDHLSILSRSGEQQEKLATTEEAILAQVWSLILGLDLESIGRNSNFVQFGGDSVRAMSLVRKLRHLHGMQLSVGDVLTSLTLKQMARAMYAVGETHDAEPKEASQHQVDPILRSLASSQSTGSITEDDIEAIYNMTPLQEGLFALNVKEPSAYVSQLVCDLPTDVDIPRLRESWQRTVAGHELLRTRIMQGSNGLLQFVIRDDFHWQEFHDVTISAFLAADAGQPMALGTALCHLALVDKKRHLVLTIHHAIYDEHSLLHVFECVNRAYIGEALPCSRHVPFRTFIEHLNARDLEQEKRFWDRLLDGAPTVHFPPLPSPSYQPRPDSIFTTYFKCTRNATVFTTSTILQGSLGILLSQYTGLADSVFGLVMSGRGSSSIAELDDVQGPMIATVPARLKTGSHQTVQAYLDHVQKLGTEMLEHQQYGLQNICAISSDSRAACNFQTLLVVQERPKKLSGRSGFQFVGAKDISFGNYALILECCPQAEVLEFHARYDSRVLDHLAVERLSNQLRHVFEQLTGSNLELVQDVETISPEDVKAIWEWNKNLPARVERTIHSIFQENARLHPEKQAVCSWDGDMTYEELDSATSRLAHVLRTLGAQQGQIIPLVFEKTKCLIVAVYAVLKTGAAFVLIDATLPRARQQHIAEVTSARLILASEKSASIAQELSTNVIVVNERILADVQLNDFHAPQPSPDLAEPSSTAYLVFTSGSTGQPKGVVMSHSAYCTSAINHAVGIGQLPGYRMLFFASHAFDGAMGEILTSLIVGGTICIPHDDERNDSIVVAMERMKVEWAFFTPSFANLLNPDDVPTLKAMTIGGEKAPAGFVAKWSACSSRIMVSGYGPSESAVVIAANKHWARARDTANIGRSLGGSLWITHPDDPEKLSLIGATGELLIEGHTLADGYFHDTAKTSKAFIQPPSWLRQRRSNPTRLYRTGDLVRYETDGTIIFVGRYDSQVKIRGQRIEIGEVELGLLKCLDSDALVAVEAVPRANGTLGLVAFIARNGDSQYDNSLPTGQIITSEDDVAWYRIQLGYLQSRMTKCLTPAMTPSVVLPINRMPLGSTGKLDRSKLRNAYSTCDPSIITQFTSLSTGRMLETDLEHMLAEKWALALGINADNLRAQDNFFNRGGDSLAAMCLSTSMSAIGMALPVKQIFECPLLCDMALIMRPISKTSTKTLPFSLLNKELDIPKLLEDVASSYGVDPKCIEDIYPCTPLQTGLIALSTASSGAYTATFKFAIPVDLDLERFRSAWNLAASSMPILRTRTFSSLETGTVQVVLCHDSGQDLCSTLQIESRGDRYVVGKPLVRLSLRKDRLLVHMHHAAYDGHFLAKLFYTVKQHYDGLIPQPSTPYRDFVSYIHSIDVSSSRNFWSRYLAGFESVHYPTVPKGVRPLSDATFDKAITFSDACSSGVTPAIIIRAAFGLLLSKYSAVSDISFGVTSSGRDASMADIHQVAGPTIATVPVRVQLKKRDQSVGHFLRSLQNESTAMIPFMHHGLQYIKTVHRGASTACDFSSLLVIQSESMTGDDLGTLLGLPDFEESVVIRHTYALTVECTMCEGGARIHVDYDSCVLKETHVTRMVRQLEFFIQQLISAPPELALAELDAVLPTERRLMRSWNSVDSDITKYKDNTLAIPQVIARISDTKPDAIAVFSATEQLTYGQLSVLSNRLASKLISQNRSARPVLILSEKGPFATVAVLSVLKSGAAFVLLDHKSLPEPDSPFIRAIKPALIISSQRMHLLARRFAIECVVVTGAALATMPSDFTCPDLDDSSTACYLDCSTSIGGATVTFLSHRSIVSSIATVAKVLRRTDSSRHLQLASPASTVGLQDLLLTLMVGGTLCSSTDDVLPTTIAELIRQLKVSSLSIPERHIEFLEPSDVSDLKVMLVEAPRLGTSGLNGWRDNKMDVVRIFTPDGSPFLPLVQRHTGINTFSRPQNGITSIVDPFDHSQLAPLGAPGLLMLRNSHVDSETSGQPRACEISTNLLCSYDDDGDIISEGLMDFHVIIDGSRVDLDGLEAALRNELILEPEFAFDFIKLCGSKTKTFLIFWCISAQKSSPSEHFPYPLTRFGDVDLSKTLSRLTASLLHKFPAVAQHEVLVAPVQEIPYLQSGRVSRTLLSESVSHLTIDDIRSLSTSVEVTKPLPETPLQKAMADAWGRVLGCTTESIGLSDSFLMLGGDSISAMRLTSIALKMNLTLSTDIIFRHPVLQAMCVAIGDTEVLKAQDIAPFSLVTANSTKDELCNEASRLCSIEAGQIEDILPLTYIQQDFLERSLRHPGMFTVRFIYTIPRDILEERFVQAWRTVSRVNVMMRTRIVQINDIFLQVFLDEKQNVFFGDSLHEYLSKDAQTPMGLNMPLMRCGIIKTEGGSRYFVHTAHHSVYDGWSLGLLMQELNKAYHGLELTRPPSFSTYVNFSRNINAAIHEEFWRSYLSGVSPHSWCEIPSNYVPNPQLHTFKDIRISRASGSEITLSTVIHAAWALTMYQHMRCPSALLGLTMSGRTAPIASIEEIMAPTITMLPLRVDIDLTQAAHAFLRDVQANFLKVLQHQHAGWQQIRGISNDARAAIDSASSIIVHPPSKEGSEDVLDIGLRKFDVDAILGPSAALLFEADLRSGGLGVALHHDGNLIAQEKVERIFQDFSRLLVGLNGAAGRVRVGALLRVG